MSPSLLANFALEQRPPHPHFYLKIPPLSILSPPSGPTLFPTSPSLTQGLEQQCAVQSEDERCQVLQAHHGHVAVDPDHLTGEAVGTVEGVAFPVQRPCDQAPSALGPSHPGCIPAAGFRGPQCGQPPCAAAPLEPWPGTGRPAGVAGSLPAATGTGPPTPRGAESRKPLLTVCNKSEADRKSG